MNETVTIIALFIAFIWGVLIIVRPSFDNYVNKKHVERMTQLGVDNYTCEDDEDEDYEEDENQTCGVYDNHIIDITNGLSKIENRLDTQRENQQELLDRIERVEQKVFNNQNVKLDIKPTKTIEPVEENEANELFEDVVQNAEAIRKAKEEFNITNE